MSIRRSLKVAVLICQWKDETVRKVGEMGVDNHFSEGNKYECKYL